MMQAGRYIPVFLLLASGVFLCASPLLAHPEIEQQIAVATKRIAQEPGNAALYLRRGELHRIHQEWVRAAADYARAERLAPDLAVVDMLRGQMLIEAGQPKHALGPLNRFLQHTPDSADGHSLRARVFAALNKNEAALADYNAAVTNAATNAINYYTERAQLLAKMGAAHLDEAVRGLDEGIARLGVVGTLEQQAIALRVTQGRYDDALARVDTLLARASRKESWLLQRSQILEKAGRYAEAIQSCRQVLAALDALPTYRRRVPAMLDLEAAANTLLQRLEQQSPQELTYANP